VLAVFVYGTLRPGSWNHDRWLAPWLAAPCRPGRLDGFELHHLDGLPYVVPGRPGSSVVGDVAELDRARADAAMARLDELEDVAGRHYDKVAVTLADGTRSWVYVAGPRVAARLGAATVVDHGDCLLVA
jgi:periplasmic divalent cation tolerance protein